MKIKVLKKKLLREAMIALAIVLVVGGGCFFAIIHAASVEEDLGKLNQQLSSTRSNTQNKQREYEEALASLEKYNKIPERRLPANDYDTLQSRIRTVRAIVEPLEKRFHLASLDVQLSRIGTAKTATDAPASKDFAILVSDITLQFQGPTDEMVYSFMQEFSDELPGYVRIKELKIERARSITPPLLQNINATGQSSALVAGTLSLTWKTIKNTGTDTKAGIAPENGGGGGTAQ